MVYNRNVQKSRSRLLNSGNNNSNSDNYLSLVTKCIPTEIVGGYLTIITILNELPLKNNHVFLWFIFVFCFLLTPIYLWRLYKVESIYQLLFSSFCFIAWAMAIGSPFEFILDNSKCIGGILTPLLSLILPLMLPYNVD